ncbi:hypothetical protein [Mangrovibacillus cuniculi]|uniref:Uncharacterized protein n=1 Tax=Mangrovibacillus cuniculi TaxID=2593652 RepID=A0A7S8CA05_9BACI|nr:hypothetical protein [Mangrovibacillus cuniculi]QPC46150.1 hypothetical protein G8O30_03840 [Mangrovibacillus cuniculi]
MSERYQLVEASSISINVSHYHQPLILTWWAAAFPGFGHLLLGKYAVGLILIFWEVLINSLTHLNHAIFLSLIGQFEEASTLLDYRFIFLYVTVYVFSIWDTYRRAVELNKIHTLASAKPIVIKKDPVNSFETNYFDLRSPILAIIWSFITPGLGYLYINRIPSLVISIILWVSLSTLAHLYEGIFFTLMGDFERARIVMDVQWSLFLPSIFVFFAYDAYVSTVEYNKIYLISQKEHLRNHYQPKHFSFCNKENE